MSAMVASAVKKTAALISKKNKKKQEKKVSTAEDSDNESIDYAAIMAFICLAPIRNTIPREIVTESGPIVMAVNLHDVNKNCGIDSDAGISISTLKEDFPL